MYAIFSGFGNEITCPIPWLSYVASRLRAGRIGGQDFCYPNIRPGALSSFGTAKEMYCLSFLGYNGVVTVVLPCVRKSYFLYLTS